MCHHSTKQRRVSSFSVHHAKKPSEWSQISMAPYPERTNRGHDRLKAKHCADMRAGATKHGKPVAAMYNASQQLQAAALPPELAG